MSANYDKAIAAGQAAFQAKDYAAAQNAYEKALHIRASYPPLLKVYAEVCHNTGDAQAEWDALSRLLVIEPANQSAARDLARLTLKAGLKDTEGLVRRARDLAKSKHADTGFLGRLKGLFGGAGADHGRADSAEEPGLTKDQAVILRRAENALSTGDSSGGHALLLQLLNEAPDHPKVLRVLVEARLSLNQFRPALQTANDLAQRGVDDIEFKALHILCAIQAAEFLEAKTLLDDLTEAERQSPQIMLQNCQLYVAQGDADAALALLDKVEDTADPAPAQAAAIRAELLAGRGDFEAALPWFEAWSARAPLSSGPFAKAGINRLLTKDTKLFEAAVKLTDTPEASPLARSGAFFAISRAYTAAKEYDTAFKCIETANALVDAVYDADEIDATTAAIKTAIAPAVLSNFDDPERGKGIVFICGLPRSGSTLATQILSAHPDAVSIGESQIFLNCLSLAEEAGYPNDFGKADDKLFADLGHYYLDNLPDYARGAKFVIDKELAKFQHLGLVKMMLPGARILHTRRNPMDVCYSVYCYNFLGWPAIYRQDTLAHFHAMHDDVMAHWSAVLPRAPHVVQYENVVADIEGETRRMLDAAGMPFHQDCLDFQKSTGSVATASSYQVRQKVYSSSIAAWKRHEEELAPLRHALEGYGTAL